MARDRVANLDIHWFGLFSRSEFLFERRRRAKCAQVGPNLSQGLYIYIYIYIYIGWEHGTWLGLFGWLVT